jgi:hypothetical protein
MIDALIAGKLVKKPVQRTGQSGKPFATGNVRVATTGEEAVFVSVIAFDNAVIAGLMALDAGDSVSLSGPLTPKVWQGKPALDLVAHGILTAYHVNRKRKSAPTITSQEQLQSYSHDTEGF